VEGQTIGVGVRCGGATAHRFSDGSPPAAIDTPDFSALEIQQKTQAGGGVYRAT
jgi:hypothetical protein